MVAARGWSTDSGLRAMVPADIVANIKDAGFAPGSFDVVVALEMLEHEDCSEQIREILRQEQEHQSDLATALGMNVPDVSGRV